MNKFIILLLQFVLVGYSGNRTYQDVLQDSFKQCHLKKETIFLKEEHKKDIIEKIGEEEFSPLLLSYKIDCPTLAKKYRAYINSHIVRTMNETIVVFVGDNGIEKLEIANFNEPLEYLPPSNWVNKFIGLKNAQELKVDGITGATLTAKSFSNSLKFILTVDALLNKH